MLNQKIQADSKDPRQVLFERLINEAAKDAGISPKTVNAHLAEIEDAGQFNKYDEKITMNVNHFEWADADTMYYVMRHEIGHMIFNETGGARDYLEAVLMELPTEKTNLLYEKLYENIQASPFYGSLKKVFAQYLIGKFDLTFGDPQHELIIRLVDESLAYWQGKKFAIKQLELMKTDKERFQIYEARVKKNQFIETLFTRPDGKSISKALNKKVSQKERMNLLNEQLLIQNKTLKHLEEEIKRILEIIGSFSGQEMDNLKWVIMDIYTKNGFLK